MDDLSERLHRHAVNRFPNGVLVVFDRDLRYRLVGPEVLPFSRREASEMTGKTIYELFPGETAAALDLVRDIAAEKELHVVEPLAGGAV